MVDWSSWLPGLPDDDPETDDPVTRTLATLGQGVGAVGSAIGSGVQAAGDAASSAGTTARGWLDDAIAGAPTLLPTPPATQPSYAPRRLEPGEPSMLEQLPAVGAEYVRGASEALGDRGALLAGMRPPETPEEVVAANAPAPFRAVRAISEIGSAAGSAGLGEFAERGAGADPTFTTNEIATPFGTIPSVEGPTPRQVGGAIGSVLGDPTNLILPGTAADRAAGVAVDNLAGAGYRAAREVPVHVADIAGAVSAPVKRTLGALGDALEGNAGRVVAADARMAAEGGTSLPGTLGAGPEHIYSPTPPAGTSRRYHGTTGAFDAADPAKFDENGLYGPGYYTTSDPRVASSYATERSPVADAARRVQAWDDMIAERETRRAAYEQIHPREARRLAREIEDFQRFRANDAAFMHEAAAREPAGPNVRAVDIPPDVKLLDADAPLTQDVLDRVTGVIDRLSQSRPDVAAELRDEVQSLGDLMAQRARSSDPVETPTDFLLQRLFGAADRVSVGIKDGSYGAKGLATEILERAGFDGIAHSGGRRVPMMDAAGEPIEHDVSVIFPGSVNKVRNAFSGTYGGATLGALPAAARIGADRFGAVNRVLSEGIAGGVGGAVIEQGRNPDEDPRTSAARGFAAGAVGFPVATRLARGAARLAGAGRDVGGGARIALGDVPPSQIRRPGLPGFEAPRPGPVPDELIPQAPRAARAPSGVAPSGSQKIGEALPDIIRALNAPPAGPAREGASLPLSSEQSGVVPRIRDTLASLASSGLNKVQTLRVAGMLSDTAGQIANVASGPVSQAIDVLTGPIAAGLDAGRVGAMRAAGKQADRQVFFGETAQRLQGMRAGAGIGLGRAVDVLKGGLDAGEAAKLEQRGGFGTNIPGIAPKGGAVAGGVDFAVEAPLRALGAADAVFKTSAQGGHLMAEAYAAARRANGGRVPTAEMIREAAKLPEVLDRVAYLSSRSVLQEDRMLTNWYKRAMSYRSSDPVEQAAADTLKAGLAVEIPFVRTPYNVVAQGMGMSPAGLLGVIQDVKQGKAAREVEQRLARVMLGTAVMAPVAAGVANGEYTGAYPDTEKERSLLPPGWRPWSRKIEAGGETYYLPLSYAGPLALPAVMAILGAEAYKKGGWSLETAGKVAAGVGQYAAQETFIDGFGEIAKLFDAKTGPATWERHAEQLAASYVPHIVGGGALGREVQRVMGMPARDPEGPIQAMEATLPYLAGTVEPRQDVLGREASLGAGGPLGAVVRAGREDDAAVLRAFRRDGEGLPMSAPDSLPDPGTGRARPLTERQQHRWRRVFGRELRTAWADAGAPSDAETLREVEAEARQAANETILGQR